ncbi:MAG: hypothetical protein IH986_09485 [Planctomycetes bacterium]|nr:hypothetical protein [Planctomycetota bacterium]
MCLIVDANVAVQVFASIVRTDFSPIQKALSNGQAVGVYGGKLKDEYSAIKSLRGIILELDRKGSLRKVSDAAVLEATKKVESEGRCRSDDSHIIALARVSEVRLLCSHDRDLHADFTNPRILCPPGSVYQNPSHRQLIRKHCADGKVNRRRTRASGTV